MNQNDTIKKINDSIICLLFPHKKENKLFLPFFKKQVKQIMSVLARPFKNNLALFHAQRLFWTYKVYSRKNLLKKMEKVEEFFMNPLLKILYYFLLIQLFIF